MPTVRKFTFDLRFDDGATTPSTPSRADGATLGALLTAHGDTGFSDTFQVGTPGMRTASAPAPSAPTPPPVIEPPPPPPGPALIYTEEDMEIAREEAYVAGHTSALEEASAATSRAAADALAACAVNLGAIQMMQAEANKEISELAARVAVEVCRTMLPHTADTYAAEEIGWLMTGVMPSLLSQPRISVRVNPAVLDAIGPALHDVARRSGFEGKVTVIDDPGVAPTDARVEWAEGGAERNTTRLWEDVDDLLQRNIPRFSRGEAVQVPGRPLPEPEPEEANPWPEIDEAAYWTPPRRD